MMTREEITRRREALGLSKSAFAREANLHFTTVSQIENGRLVAYPGQMAKIEQAFARLEAEKAGACHA